MYRLSTVMTLAAKNASAALISRNALLEYMDEQVPGYSTYRNFHLVALFAMAGLAIPMNLAVMTKLVQRHFWRSNVYILLFQLAIADFLVAAFCIVGEAGWNITLRWLAGDCVCRLFKFLQMFSFYASTFILTSISIDRCVCVLFPLTRSGGKGKLRRVRGLSAAAWLLAALCALPQAFIFHTETAPFSEPFEQCVTFGVLDQWEQAVYGACTATIMFFAPVLIMVACYSAIFLGMTQEARHASGDSDQSAAVQPETQIRRLLYSQARKRVLFMTLVFVIVFIICWAPYYVKMFYDVFQVKPLTTEGRNLIFGFGCFGMCTAIINPVIYGSFNLRPSRRSQESMSKSVKFRYQLVRPFTGKPQPALNNRDQGPPPKGHDALQYVHAHDHPPRLVVQFKPCPDIVW